jgi:hypothetical protein
MGYLGCVVAKEHDPTETCNCLPNTLPREYSRKREGYEIEKSIGNLLKYKRM